MAKRASAAAVAVRYETLEAAGEKRERKSRVVDAELKRLHDAGKEIRPETVLALARNPKHPLHQFFEWEDSVAAEKYRLNQAWQLIRASKFVCFLNETKGEAPASAEPAKVRAFLSVGKGEPFKMRNEALDDAVMRRQVIERKKSELRAWCRSVVDIAEFAELREAILRSL